MLESEQIDSGVATEEQSEIAGQQARNGAPLRRRSSDRPEPLGREGTLEVSDPLPPMLPGIVRIEGGQSATAPMDWDAEPIYSARLIERFRDPAVRSGVRRMESAPSACAGLNIAPAGFLEDERRRENDERAGTGRKKRKKKGKGPNLKKENLMSVLFDIELIEWQASSGERAREGPERGENLLTATTAALPLERPALRAARHDTRREKRPVVIAPQNPPDDRSRRGWKRGEWSAVGSRHWSTATKHTARGNARACEKARRAKWLGRDGCRVRGAQFGGLVHVPVDPRVDAKPFTCFNCRRPRHRMAECAEPRVLLVCYNCG